MNADFEGGIVPWFAFAAFVFFQGYPADADFFASACVVKLTDNLARFKSSLLGMYGMR